MASAQVLSWPTPFCRRDTIDLLPDREGSTLEGWLKSHPEVELIARDRALAYADGATKGAPQAVQVADRFHLIKNLVEAFENLVRRRSSVLREAALEVSPRRHLREQSGGDRLVVGRLRCKCQIVLQY